MTPRELLWQYGHQYCPENYAIGDVLSESQFLTVPDTDPSVMAAARSYQEWFRADLDQLSYRSVQDGGYSRAIIADGEIGPLTEQVLRYPRCGCRDYQAREAEQGNWPDACRQDITIAWDFDMLPGTDMVRTGIIFDTAAGNWNSAIDVHIIPDKENRNPKGMITLANLPGSVLADQYLATGDCTISQMDAWTAATGAKKDSQRPLPPTNTVTYWDWSTFQATVQPQCIRASTLLVLHDQGDQ